jgi:chromosome segregation ATPase
MCGKRLADLPVLLWLAFCFLLFSFAVAPIYPQSSPTQNEDIRRLLQLLSEQRTAFSELETLSEKQSEDLTGLTNQLIELQMELAELSRELRRARNELEISKEESASLRLQLQLAQALLEELQQDTVRLRKSLDDSYQSETRAIRRADRAERNFLRSLIAGTVGWVLFALSFVF